MIIKRYVIEFDLQVMAHHYCITAKNSKEAKKWAKAKLPSVAEEGWNTAGNTWFNDKQEYMNDCHYGIFKVNNSKGTHYFNDKYKAFQIY